MKRHFFLNAAAGLLVGALLFTAACNKQPAAAQSAAKPPKHEHHPLHGGTPVVLGDEVYHLELVREAATGRLSVYVFDGELENFVRSSASSFEVTATVAGVEKTLVFKPVANPATGETAGDSSLFTAEADWLKDTREFDAVLKTITVRGTTFSDVKFNFPKGNDHDAD